MAIQNGRYIPNGATTQEYPDVNAVVYMYETNGSLFAIAYGGKRSKPDWHFRFRNREQLEKRVREYVENLKAVADWKAEQKQKRQQAHSLKVGDILVWSWGWEQTNVDWFVVDSTTEKTVTIRSICSQLVEGTGGAMSGHSVPCQPVRYRKDGKTLTKRPYNWEGHDHISMPHGCCQKWDGKPEYVSWYA